MNDPGLDDPIQDGAKTVEQEKDDESLLAEEEEQAFLTPRSVTDTHLTPGHPSSDCPAVDGGLPQPPFP